MMSEFDNKAKDLGLSYFIKENTKELIKRNEKLKNAKKLSAILYLITIIMILITFFPNKSSINEMTILVALLILLIPIYIGSIFVSNAKKAFSEQRAHIVDNLNADFCIHKSDCKCKDEYLKYLKEQEKINLLY